ncbi:MAG: Fmu (Sun) domain-containing protein [Ferruginibacter sp.]|nr:Fmu (Sun) domain-containing protein [Ferruginibacter sp.]
MRYYSYLNTAKKIIESYKGDVPFAIFLKKYFSANKKLGAKDRKQVSALCYNYFRPGKALPQLPVDEKIIVSVFLCNRHTNEFLQFHKPEWNQKISIPLEEKLEITNIDITKVFPFSHELSAGIDFESFSKSFFYQPGLFLRIRPGNKDEVLKKLQAAGLEFELLPGNCIALANAINIDSILKVDEEVVVQDCNSQKVLDILKDDKIQTCNLQVWDCCAASGGKSILVYDILQGKINLTVSDIRESILTNLKKRFEKAGIKKYQSFIADLSVENCRLPKTNYQLIICDAPCTGSGTWSRTPEQLFYFNPQKINEYSTLQKKIVRNAITQLQPGGMFIYITCSVFKKENEEVTNFIKSDLKMQLIKMELLKGYNNKADSMFVAVFKN